MKNGRKLRPETEEKSKKEETKETMTANEFFDALDGVKTTPTAARKSTDKMISLNPPTPLKKKIDEIVKFKKAEKEAKAERESREVDVVDWAKKEQDEEALANNFQKSFRLPGEKEVITYVSADSFSALKPEDLPGLKEVFGSKFDEFFMKKVSVSFRSEVMEKPELQKKLMSYIPKEEFPIFFEKTERFYTADGFDRKVFDFVKNLSSPKKLLEKIREFVKQKSPSLK